MPEIYRVGEYCVLEERDATKPEVVRFVVAPFVDQYQEIDEFYGTSASRKWYNLFMSDGDSDGDGAYIWRTVEEASEKAYTLANRLAGISSEMQARVNEVAETLRLRERAYKELAS